MRGGVTFIGQLWAQEGQRTVFDLHRALTHFLGFAPQRNMNCLFTPHAGDMSGTCHASFSSPGTHINHDATPTGPLPALL